LSGLQTQFGSSSERMRKDFVTILRATIQLRLMQNPQVLHQAASG
jgi:hypothetical protein